MKILLLTILFALVLNIQMANKISAGDVVLVRWYGHACFSLESADGTKVLIDPFSDIGYDFPAINPDIITITHEHFDHNNTDPIQGSPEILRGLKNDGTEWNNLNKKVHDFSIFTVPVYHDKNKGKQRGKNSVFVYDVSGLRFVHVGDLGHVLLDNQVKKIGKVDVLMLPVGGVYTINAGEASRVVEQLKPRIVIPMHYETIMLNFELDPVDKFLKGKDHVKKIEGNLLGIDKDHMPDEQEIVVLNFE